ncbi:glycosyltransferase family 1 protein [Roseibium sp. SCP14]|uniref:glycosyltransferase family 1 protein n=1 Tax=Roseibium sp. SCP14 TaxID=3141375 RepID=UPI0033382EDA
MNNGRCTSAGLITYPKELVYVSELESFSLASTRPNTLKMSSRRYLVMTSDTTQTCGVEEFARILACKFDTRAQQHTLSFDIGGLRKAFQNVDAIVFNFPVVAWKKKLIEPFLAALIARASGKEIVVILHEWDALNWKRQAILIPVLLLATKICFSAPEIAEEFAGCSLARATTKRRGVVPIPPNLIPSTQRKSGNFSDKLKQERQKGRLILGQFGSIYPQKHVTAALDVSAELRKHGYDVFAAFAGSFIKGQDTVEQDFLTAVHKLDLSERVAVSGFIESPEELFAIFNEIDVFFYLLPGGLTSRRASVLAAALSGKPVVVNAPDHDDALDHHHLFEKLIETGCLQLIPTNADIGTAAEAILAARQTEIGQIPFNAEIEQLWDDVLSRIDNFSD